MAKTLKILITKDFTLTVLKIFPNQSTENRFRDVPPVPLRGKYALSIYWALIHAITLINQKQRKKNKKGSYITKREDIEAANNLLMMIIKE